MEKKNIGGPIIKKYRTQQGLTQKQLQDKLKQFGFSLSLSAISQKENGLTPIWDYEVLLFAAALQIPLSEWTDACMDPKDS